jgi:hypothetical protein
VSVQPDLEYDERRDEEAFLLTVRAGTAHDLERAKRGDVPYNWAGSSAPDVVGKLGVHLENVDRAIQHVRTGGPLADIVPIVWGMK